MIAEFDDSGELTKLKPNRDHPVSRGFACHKGLSFLQVHNDPDRLNDPMRRTTTKTAATAEFEAIRWDTAITEIADKITSIQEKYGPNSVAVYMGNPVGFNCRAFNLAVGFAQSLGTKYGFSANTQDLANKFAGALHMFGSYSFTVPDLYHTDLLVGFGWNPKISKGTIICAHDYVEAIDGIRARGGKVRFINPRKIESARDKETEVLQVKPDTDVYFMAALLHELDHMGAYDENVIAKWGKNIEGMRAFVSQYPAERVASVIGIPANDIKTLAHDIARAKSAAFFMATGVNQNRQGTLAFWLINMLSFVTGNLGREGGNYKPPGDAFVSEDPVEPDPIVETPVGPIQPVWGDLPCNIMADLIEAEASSIKALITLSGNPILAMPGEDRVREAFKKLELLVCVDLYRSPTGELADYLLPASDWLERADANIFSMGIQLTPYAMYSDAMVEPKGNRKNDWWILSSLLNAMGKPSPLDTPDTEGWEVVDMALNAHGLSREELKSLPNQSKLMPQMDDKSRTLNAIVLHRDKKIDCCPEVFSSGMARAETLFRELEAEDPGMLKLIGLRTNYMHNSWLANMPQLRKGRHSHNPLHINPDDAEDLGLTNGQKVRVFNQHGEIEADVRVSRDLRRGVVAMTHGYGHRHSPGLSLASEMTGVNPARLYPTGAGSYEELSGMSWMNAVPVAIEPVPHNLSAGVEG
jgi:anaerobic selenocysteine-containing dehydrogenase